MRFYLLLFLFFNSFSSFSQVFSPIPFIFTDPGDFLGSGVCVGNYLFLENAESELSASYEKLLKQRRRSLRYFTGKFLDIKIKTNVNSLRERFDDLNEKNSKLSRIYYSKRAKNEVKLNFINDIISNLENSVKNFPLICKYGDALTFYENMAGNSEKIHLIMDNIEDDISDSVFNVKLVTNAKKN